MHKILFSCISLLLITAIACQKDDNQRMEAEKFLGSYEIESRHISGVQTFYDSVGNITGQGFDTTTLSSQFLSITTSADEDTLIIADLINSFQHARSIAKAVVRTDTLRIVHELTGASTRNNYIRGDIWLEGDSIHLDYIWDKSDTWSAQAPPERGEVRSAGIIIR